MVVPLFFLFLKQIQNVCQQKTVTNCRILMAYLFHAYIMLLGIGSAPGQMFYLLDSSVMEAPEEDHGKWIPGSYLLLPGSNSHHHLHYISVISYICRNTPMSRRKRRQSIVYKLQRWPPPRAPNTNEDRWLMHLFSYTVLLTCLSTLG